MDLVFSGLVAIGGGVSSSSSVDCSFVFGGFEDEFCVVKAEEGVA